jgi:hypothetical protein
MKKLCIVLFLITRTYILSGRPYRNAIRPFLNKQLGRVKRGILPNALTSEMHSVYENFTNSFCITPHLCTLQLYNETLKRHPSNSPFFPLSCRFLPLYIKLNVSLTF